MRKNPPVVSICCAFYNRADFIKSTIDSLLSQNFSDFEIIAINDGSTDPSVAAILDSYEDKRLKIIHQENLGFVRSITKAVALSTGEYIALQGAGDVSLPDRLATQLKLLEENMEVGVVGCKIINIIKGGKYDGHQTSPKYRTLKPVLEDFLYHGNPISHGEVMFRKSIYDLAGGYRSFFKFAQDRDLWIRMAQLCQFQICDKVLYNRHNFVTDGVSTNRKKLVVQQAMSHFARQCYFDKEKNGVDYIDIYGMDAGLFRRKSKDFAKKIAKQSLQSLLGNSLLQAKELAKIALDEKLTPVTIITYLTVSLSLKSKKFRTLVNKVLGKITRNSESWLSRT